MEEFSSLVVTVMKNRTSCLPILPVIILVIDKSESPSRRPILLITRTTKD